MALTGRESQERGARVTRGARLMLTLGVVAITTFAAGVAGLDKFTQALGVLLLVAAAASICGGLVGFMLGLPRTYSGAEEGKRPAPRILPNTNLEQISDWFTKVLVGIGLVEASTLANGVYQLAVSIQHGLDQSSAFAVGVIAIVVYYAAAGFLFGFLWTRLELGGAMHEADRLGGEDMLAAVYRAEGVLPERERVDLQKARHQVEARYAETSDRKAARAAVEQAISELEVIRREQDISPERTFEMEKRVARIRASASRWAPSSAEVRALHQDPKGAEACRVAALAVLQALWFDECLELVLDSIGNSRSAFEQYHALRVAERVCTLLDPQCRRRLVAALHEQEDLHLTPDNRSRFQLKEHILHRIGSLPQPPLPDSAPPAASQQRPAVSAPRAARR